MSKEKIEIDKILDKCESISWKPCINELITNIDETLDEDEKKLLREKTYEFLVRSYQCSAITTFRYIYEKWSSNLADADLSKIIEIIKDNSAYIDILVHQFLQKCEQYQQATTEDDKKRDGDLYELTRLKVKAWLLFEIEINVVIEAVKQNKPHALRLILEAFDFTENMNKRDCYGNYAINLAATWGLKKCVEVLLLYNVNFHIPIRGTIQSSKAFKYAHGYGHDEIVKMFEDYQQYQRLEIIQHPDQNLKTLNAAFFSGFISEFDYFRMVESFKLDIKKALLCFIRTISERLAIEEDDERWNSHRGEKGEFDSLVLPTPIIKFCYTLTNKPLLKSSLETFSCFNQKTETGSGIYVIENLEICISEMTQEGCPCAICVSYFVILVRSKPSIEDLCGDLDKMENKIDMSTSSDEKMKTRMCH